MNCFASRRLKEGVRELGRVVGQDPDGFDALEVLSAPRTPGFGPLFPVTMEGQPLQRSGIEAALSHGSPALGARGGPASWARIGLPNT